MKGIVEQYARGEFKVDSPAVAISVSKIELNIEAGTVYDGEFTVDSSNSCAVKLMVYYSRYILDFKSHTFVGRKNRVSYSFDARGIEQGKSFKGHINIITDGGEFIIPYHIAIVAPYIQVEGKKLEDLFQFATYAEENWEDAIRIFGSEDFVRTFIGRDEKLQRVYDTLGMSLSIGQAMEEFLVYTHKKRALTLSVAQNDLLVEMPSELVRASVTITKNTWGYTNTKIASDCDFLIPETSVLKWNSFDGNTFDLSFLIDPQKIHDAGRGFGVFQKMLAKAFLGPRCSSQNIPHTVQGKRRFPIEAEILPVSPRLSMMPGVRPARPYPYLHKKTQAPGYGPAARKKTQQPRGGKDPLDIYRDYSL